MKLHKLDAVLAFGLHLFRPGERQCCGSSLDPAFNARVPQAALEDLRWRISEIRWPDRETVNDQSQGIQLAKPQAARPKRLGAARDAIPAA